MASADEAEVQVAASGMNRKWNRAGSEQLGLARQGLRRWSASSLILMALMTVVPFGVACAGGGAGGGPRGGPGGPDGFAQPQRFRSGISVLLSDSIGVIAGKRVAIITNQTGVDEKRNRSIDLLHSDKRAVEAGVKLVRIFAPEHGLAGTEDRPEIGDAVDTRTGLPVVSLYRRGVMSPPDSLLADIDVLIVDLQDIGTRTWTYTGVMLYGMEAAGRNKVRYVVVDHPNPISAAFTEGALLDSALANPNEPPAGTGGNGFALWPLPLRHGLTMAELARLFHEKLELPTDLVLIPMQGYFRGMWLDDTPMPWVRPSPNMPSIISALLYPALVPFERTNVSVGRGTNEAFQRFGAPWLNADSVARMLDDLSLSGVRFRAEQFTPRAPTDGKYDGLKIPGVRIEVTERSQVQPSRIGTAVLWALLRMHGDSLTIDKRGFDERLGSVSVREALERGADPDAVMDRQLPSVVDFERQARRFHLYR